MRATQSGLQYLLTDHLGSVVAIADASGTLTSQQRYLPFGQLRTDLSGPRITQTDFGYTGQRDLGNEIGLYDYRARFYDSLLMRFISPDSVTSGVGSQAYNRFTYVNSNPVNATDPSGHVPCDSKIIRDDQIICLARSGGGSSASGGGGGGNQGSGGSNGNGANCGQGDVYDCPPTPPTVVTNGSSGIYPQTLTYYPLDSNIVYQRTIYDYSYIPPQPVGYEIGYYDADSAQTDWIGFGKDLLPIPDLSRPLSLKNVDLVYTLYEGTQKAAETVLKTLEPLGIVASEYESPVGPVPLGEEVI